MIRCVCPHRALGAVLRDGHGRFVPQWDDRVWAHWRKLGWDCRPDPERAIQPPEIDAYILTPAEVWRLLGVSPVEDTWYVLFIRFDGPDNEATPQWAVVVGETRLAENADDEQPITTSPHHHITTSPHHHNT